MYTALIAPTIGSILAIARHVIATREVLEVRKTQNLGDLNPIPFASAILNCSGGRCLSP